MADIEISTNAGKRFLDEARLTMWFALVVFLPGRPVPNFSADQNKSAPLDQLGDQDLEILIAEANGQLNRQRDDLKTIRSTAQWLTTLDLLALPIGVGVLIGDSADKMGPIAILILLTGLISILFGLLSAIGVVVGYAPLGVIHSVRLTHSEPPLKQKLAESLTRTIPIGENTVATRRTVLRASATLTVVGAIVGFSVVAIAFTTH